jgi:hypothetical protein
MNTNRVLAAAVVMGGFVGAAQAATVDATITADNHYSLYSSAGGVFSYHGGNEIDAGGSNGGYNWSEAESYTFNAGDYVYIAAWSDDSTAQGVLANMWINNVAIHSGNAAWQVYKTDVNRGDGDAHPSTFEISNHVAFADANTLWEAPHVGGANGLSPWGTIAGINGEANWMWASVVGDDDPLQGGSGAGEMLIFRTTAAVPAPGAAMLAGIGGLVLARRRR